MNYEFKEGDRVIWRWKGSAPCSFHKETIYLIYAGYVEFSRTSWIRLDEIDIDRDPRDKAGV